MTLTSRSLLNKAPVSGPQATTTSFDRCFSPEESSISKKFDGVLVIY
jgi:hypothetical protein